jgi:glutathione S-transferase
MRLRMRSLRLYTLCISHPGLAVRGMLVHKDIDHKVVELWPGTHPLALRLRGYTGSTVPALRIGGRRLQDSRAIARALEELAPEPALFPTHARRRREVVDAERWGAEIFQEVPRRIFRLLCAREPDVRRWLGETAGIPLPGLVAREALLARRFARQSGADEEAVRADLERLPRQLDYIAMLVGLGVLGGEQPNAADFQIAATVRSLQGLGDIGPFIDRHDAVRWAKSVVPALPGPCPPRLPGEWLAPLALLTRG